eukprot:COSAG02_NODE_37388_length_442_cov_1.268222_1_plen_48_part_10
MKGESLAAHARGRRAGGVVAAGFASARRSSALHRAQTLERPSSCLRCV